MSSGQGAAADVSQSSPRIVDFQTLTFRYRSRQVRDHEGHSHPGPEHDAVQTLTRVRTSVGVDGHCFGGTEATAQVANQLLIGLNPLDRELIWKKLRQAQRSAWSALHDRHLAVIDQTLWDFAGKLTGLPVSKLLGGSRESVPAYASSMCGDDVPGGLGRPEDYADFAETCVAQGYRAFKLHTWMPPFGADVRRDLLACRAVRERVGPDIALMLDPHHDYTREEALFLGRGLEELGFAWMEEPMPEHNVSSYVWLCQNLDLPIVGPETAEGKMYTRAEWIVRGACDMSRYGAWQAGITPAMKVVHLCESFGIRLELHSPGAGNLQILGAMAFPGEYYERGLLHPHYDYEAAKPWLQQVIDPVDANGNVAISQKPGLGEEIDWEFIRANELSSWR